MTKQLPRLILVAALALGVSTSRADDAGDAASAATRILELLQKKEFERVWETQTSEFFKRSVSKDSFLANMTLGRQQLGPVQRGSAVVDIAYTKEDSATKMRGEIYAINFVSSYAAGKFYERIVVIKERDGRFRLSGIWGAPAK